ncbi:hypothetical protein [Noviherbaspirillum soli]|nr:hypothetical protein [Noviherbaspirillum soli]
MYVLENIKFPNANANVNASYRLRYPLGQVSMPIAGQADADAESTNL